MQRSARLAPLALLVTLTLASGCAAPAAPARPAPAPAAPATGSAAPASPQVEATAPVVAVSSGQITKPSLGSPVRAALMDAARKGLGLTSKFVVYQLYVQGKVAVGDLKPESGGSRTFVAWSGGPDAWKVVWTAPFGSSEANAAGLAGVEAVSPELAAKLVWNLPAPATDAAMLASFKKYAQASVKSFAGAYTGGFSYTYRIAKTPAGVWYGNCLAQPNQPGLEPIGIYGKYSGGKWGGRVAEFGVENDDAAFFPASVLSALQL